MKRKNLSLDEVLNVLKERKTVFEKKFGVNAIGIFGSFARGKSGPGSDVDKDIFDHLPLKLDRKSWNNEVQAVCEDRVTLEKLLGTDTPEGAGRKRPTAQTLERIRSSFPGLTGL